MFSCKTDSDWLPYRVGFLTPFELLTPLVHHMKAWHTTNAMLGSGITLLHK